jgi:hypothetical protein
MSERNNEIRWWWANAFTRWFYPIDLWVVMIGLSFMALQRDFPLAFAVLAAVFLWRFGRVLTLGVALLPDRLLVKRCLSLGPETIPLDSVHRCVFHRHLFSEMIVIYQRPRWRPPVSLVSGPGIGWPSADWQKLSVALREIFEPQGKWERRPWWYQPNALW